MIEESYYGQPRKEIRQFLPSRPIKRVLEVGCGAGMFRKTLASSAEYWGVEYVPEVAERASGVLDHVLVGAFDDVYGRLPQHAFDLIVCNDVIEHMPDTNKFLTQAKTLLAHGGCIIGSIPNVRFICNLFYLLVCRDWEYRDCGILDRTHLRFFTKKSWQRTLKQNGYQIEQVKMINAIGANVSKMGIHWRLLFFAIRIIGTICLGRDTIYLQIGFRAIPAEDNR